VLKQLFLSLLQNLVKSLKLLRLVVFSLKLSFLFWLIVLICSLSH